MSVVKKSALLPLVCDECGSANRPKAKYCGACAARLAGVEPSGLPTSTTRSAHLAGPRFARPLDRQLPAERPGFWLRLMVLGVASTVAFMAWYLYITREIAAPAPPAEIAAAPSPDQAVPLPAATSEVEAVTAPAALALPDATAPAPEAPARKAERPAARQRTPALDARPRVRTPGSWQEEEPPGPSPVAVERALALARQMNNSAPPGTGEAGPRYNSPRPAPRLADDPGPPIAVGPGPLVDYSTPGGRSR